MRDSAGIEIVENSDRSCVDSEGWHVEEVPGLRFGVQNGEAAYQFSGVATAMRLSHGRIVVADRMSVELRYFDDAGDHLASIGRSGDEPGEFGSIG